MRFRQRQHRDILKRLRAIAGGGVQVWIGSKADYDRMKELPTEGPEPELRINIIGGTGEPIP